MAINLKKIEDITFSQSFRGYNTDEVDDYLDEIYDEAVQTNQKIKELAARINELESSGAVGAVMSADDSKIIEDARRTAEEIISKATKTAQEIIAESQKKSENANIVQKEVTNQDIYNLKLLIKETYDKQMRMIEEMASGATDNTSLQFQKVPEPQAEIRTEIQPKQPGISFAGIVNKPNDRIEDVVRKAATNDIYSEMNSIGLNSANQYTKREVTEEQSDFEELPQQTYEEKKPVSPDDIIAQILKDNNRN